MSLKKLTPMTMEDLRNLRDYTLEKERLKIIDNLVCGIYGTLCYSAEKSLDHFFYYDINEWHGNVTAKREFILKNKSDIINELSKVFPDCLIEVKNMIKSQKNEFIDISDLNREVLKFVNENSSKLCIFIDYRNKYEENEETY